MTLLMNYINSIRRSKLDGNTPYKLADSPKFRVLKEALGLNAIPADEIKLTPGLLKNVSNITRQTVTAHNPIGGVTFTFSFNESNISVKSLQNLPKGVKT